MPLLVCPPFPPHPLTSSPPHPSHPYPSTPQRYLRESPKSQKPWVDFCISVLRIVSAGKASQKEAWFDSFQTSPTSTTTTTTTTTTSTTSISNTTTTPFKSPGGGATTPSKTLANSYVMADYDVPNLNEMTLTLIDGRDEVRGIIKLTVPWPDIKDINTEHIPVSIFEGGGERESEGEAYRGRCCSFL